MYPICLILLPIHMKSWLVMFERCVIRCMVSGTRAYGSYFTAEFGGKETSAVIIKSGIAVNRGFHCLHYTC